MAYLESVASKYVLFMYFVFVFVFYVVKPANHVQVLCLPSYPVWQKDQGEHVGPRGLQVDGGDDGWGEVHRGRGHLGDGGTARPKVPKLSWHGFVPRRGFSYQRLA